MSGYWDPSSPVPIYREIAQSIPGDVLYHICQAMEDERDKDVVHRKYHKNANVLSMMDVCRWWNAQIHGLTGLFADIAFDTSDNVTISTAEKFLGIIETRSSDLRVFARFPVWNNDQAQNAFISRLRLQSGKFVHFEAEDMPTPIIANFDLPAPRLLRLVHASPLSKGLFASSFPNLATLDVSVKESFPWPTAALSNLVVLRLTNFPSTFPFCATSLFDLIGHTPHLEKLQLIDFLQFSGNPETKPLVCTSVKSVCLVQCNARFIFQLLQLPNARNIHIEAYGIGLAGESHPESSSMALGYFSPLEGCFIPILERHLFSKVAIHVQDLLANNVYFKLGLESGAGRKIDFTVALRKHWCWEDYFRKSMHGILQRVRLGLRVELSIFNYLPSQLVDQPSIYYPEPPSPSIYSPFLHLPQVTVLRTGYSLARSIMARLVDSEQAILPNLKCYSFDVEMSPTSMNPVAPEIATCLQSRFSSGLPFAIQYWEPNGKMHP